MPSPETRGATLLCACRYDERRHRAPRYLITRAEEDAIEWARRIERLGARAVVFPCLECGHTTDDETQSLLRRAVSGADWLVVTSRRGAVSVAQMMNAPLPATVFIAAVGPETAKGIAAQLGRKPDVVASVAPAKELGAELARRVTSDATHREARIVIAAATGGRSELEQDLRETGARITRVEVYRTVPAPPADTKRDLAMDAVDAIWLASPSAVLGLLNRAVVPHRARVITIGPTTSAAARATGLRVDAEARHQSFAGLLEATV